MMKRLAPLLLLVSLPLTTSAAVSFPLDTQTGEHKGEERFLEYRIEYLAPRGITRVDESSITFAPFCCAPHTEAATFPEKYFGDYALYFSGEVMRFRLSIQNTGKRMYKNLLVVAAQEYFNAAGAAGDPIGAANVSQWFVEELAGGEEIALDGFFRIPRDGISGLDQTHLQILHWEDSDAVDDETPSGGRIIVDDPQAGIWCPV